MFGGKRIQYAYNRNRIFKKLLGLKILEPRSPQWDLQRTAMIKKNDKNTPNEKLSHSFIQHQSTWNYVKKQPSHNTLPR